MKIEIDTGPDRKAIEFQFKYFQTIEGRIELPENFQPRRVFVRLFPQNSAKVAAERAFDWAESVS